MRPPRDPARRRRRRRSVAAGLWIGVVSALLAAPAAVPGAGAQGPPGPGSPAAPTPNGRAPFPADRIAVIPANGEPGTPGEGPIPPPLALNDLYVVSGTNPASPEVVLRFAEGFTLPDDGYRLSVIVGDPFGPRLAASLVASGGGERAAATVAGGLITTFDGFAWHDVGPSDVQFDDLGFALVTLPLGLAPPGPALWVEIALGSPLIPQRVSPYFSRSALLDAGSAGELPGDVLGVSRERRGRPDQLAVPLGEPPRLSLRQGAAVIETGTLPIQVLDQPVTGVVDVVRLVDSYNRGGRTAEVRLDRGKGTVGLFDTSSDPPQDRTGDRTWLRRAPGSGRSEVGIVPSGSAGSIELDLAALGRTLGIEPDPALTALAIRRIVTLANGQVMTAEGVLATVASLALAAPRDDLVPTRAKAAGVVTPAEPESAGPWLWLAAVVLLAAVLSGTWVRRRRVALAPAAPVPGTGRGGPDRVPWDDSDRTITAPVPVVRIDLDTSDGPVGAGPSRLRQSRPSRPARARPPGSGRRRAPGDRPAGERRVRSSRPAPAPSTPTPSHASPLAAGAAPPVPAAPAPAAPEPAPARAPAAEGAGVHPADVLAALDGEVSALHEAIDDL